MKHLKVVMLALITAICISACSNNDANINSDDSHMNSMNVQDNKNNSQSHESSLASSQEPTLEPTPKATPEPSPSVQQDIPSLAMTFADYFPIGAAIEPHQTSGLVSELLKKQVNMLVAENAMKPSSLQPVEGQFNFASADKIVQFAKENNMEVRFHTLVWHTQVGEWFFLDENGRPMVDETDEVKKAKNKKLLLNRLETHVKTIVTRYKDDITSWDVVNEVVEPNDPDGMRASAWYKITGTEYIEVAFRAAREAGGPNIKLYINDYGTDSPVKRERLLKLVKELLDKGIPIDGVGHQTHISIHGPMVENIILSMKKFAELGLDNIVTELDMSLYTWNDHSDFGDSIPEQILQKQADRYGQLFKAFIENKDILSEVTLWGISDAHTWLSGFPIQRTEAPLLFDKYFQAKPAFWSVIETVNK